MVGEQVLKAQAIWAINLASKQCFLFLTLLNCSPVSKIRAPTQFLLVGLLTSMASLTMLIRCIFLQYQLCRSVQQGYKKKQQDLAIRYWIVNLKKLGTRYERSEFLGNSTAESFVKRFNKATALLDPQKVIHLRMDGSAINN